MNNIPKTPAASIESQYNIGSPYVVLTSDMEIVDGTKDFTPDPKTILLSVDKGSLISFSEKFDPNSSSEAPHSIVLKFLDEEGTFIPRLFQNSVLNKYKTFLDKVAETVGREDYKAFIKSPAEKKIEDLEIVLSQFDLPSADPADDLPKNPETTPPSKPPTDATKLFKERLQKNDAVSVYDLDKLYNDSVLSHLDLFVTYGYGHDSDNKAPYRKFRITRFVVVQDDTGNSQVSLTMVPSGPQAEQELTEEETAVPSNAKTRANAGTLITVPIAKAAIVPYNEARQSRIKLNNNGQEIPDSQHFRLGMVNNFEWENTECILNCLENLFQRVLLDASTDKRRERPYVFLSPRLIPAIKKKAAEYASTQLFFQGYGDQTKSTFHKIIGYKELLSRCGIEFVSEILPSDKKVLKYVKGGGSSGGGGNRRLPIETLSMGLSYDPTKYPNCIDYIYSVIRRLYDECDLPIGMYAASRPVDLSNKDHALAFVKASHTEEEDKLWSDDYLIELKGSNKIERDDKNTYGSNFKIDETYQTSGFYNVYVLTDHEIGTGLITALPPSFQSKVVKEYVKQVKQISKDSAEQYCNVNKFISNIEDYINSLKNIYPDIEKGNKINDLPDEFAIRQLGIVESVLETIPKFVFNLQHSNVHSVIFEENNEALAQLSKTFQILSTKIRQSYSEVVFGGDGPEKLEFDEELFDEIVVKAILSGEESNANIRTLLKSLATETGQEYTENSDLIELYDQIKETIKEAIEQSNYTTELEISYASMAAYLYFLQSMSNTISLAQISTHPNFSKVAPRWIKQPALFLHRNLAFRDSIRQPTQSYVSGIYLIIGYEHVITSSECYSKFNLMRLASASDEFNKLTPKGEETQE